VSRGDDPAEGLLAGIVATVMAWASVTTFVGCGVALPFQDLGHRVERAGLLLVAELGVNGWPALLDGPLLQRGRGDADDLGGDPAGDGYRLVHYRSLPLTLTEPYGV
jgi:hypothetical protein